MTPERIRNIRERRARLDGHSHLMSTCGEHQCNCHHDLPAALEEIERLRELLAFIWHHAGKGVRP